MDTSRGAELARLLLGGFDAMIEEVTAELARQGHPGVTASLEFALQAVDGGAGNAADLSRALGVSRQAAAKSITALEELGYVERRSDPADARRKQVTVTAHGYDMVRIGSTVLDDIRTRWSEQLGPKRLGALEAGLRTLLQSDQHPSG